MRVGNSHKHDSSKDSEATLGIDDNFEQRRRWGNVDFRRENVRFSGSLGRPESFLKQTNNNKTTVPLISAVFPSLVRCVVGPEDTPVPFLVDLVGLDDLFPRLRNVTCV